MLDAGARLRRDYSRYFEKHGAPIPEIAQPFRMIFMRARGVLIAVIQGRTLANLSAFIMQECYAFMACLRKCLIIKEAEGVRFELTRPFGLPVFKTGAINRSATPPFAPVKTPIYLRKKAYFVGLSDQSL